MFFDTVKLRSQMIKNDVRQTELAKKSGISYSMLNAICRGRACSNETADKIAEALEVPLKDLIENGGA